jgi:hypothetical protein
MNSFVKIERDVADVLDQMAILTIKSKSRQDPRFKIEFTRVVTALRESLGIGNFLAICNSPEYFSLLDANQEVFDLVAKAEKDECKASDVFNGNMKRFLAKKALQEKYFGQFNEVKI